MSYILNQSGILIPAATGKTVTGADKRNYFFRVPDLIDFLKQRWGNPDSLVSYPPSGGGTMLAGKKGLFFLKFPGGVTHVDTQLFGTEVAAMTTAISMNQRPVTEQTELISGTCHDFK